MNKLLGKQGYDEKNVDLLTLKVKWMENGMYNKDNLTSLFSKVIYQNYILNICLILTLYNIIVWQRCKSCASGKHKCCFYCVQIQGFCCKLF